MANNEDVLERFKDWSPSTGDDVVTVHLLLDLSTALRSARERIAELERDRELLTRLHAAWTHPNRGSIGALLDEVAERIEPGVFGDAAMSAERGGDGE